MIGSSFQYTADKAEEIERRLIPLIKKEDESYKRLVLESAWIWKSKQIL